MTPPELAAGNQATRFVHHRRDLLRAGGVKPSAFEPGRDGTTSIADITGASEEDVWATARHTLNAETHRARVLARADFDAGAAVNQGLRCVRDDIDFFRHGYLDGWGVDVSERRARWKAIAGELCDAATVRHPPQDIALPGMGSL